MRSAERFALLALGLFLVTAACNGAGDGNGTNRCAKAGDCAGATVCDEARAICVNPEPTQPYELVLQVDDMPSGEGLLRRFTFTASSFSASDEARLLEVPPGLSIPGKVRRLVKGDGGKPDSLEYVAAELSFSAQSSQTGFRVTPAVVTSSHATDTEPSNFVVTIAPERAYDVVIQPLGEFSEDLPPVHKTFVVEPQDPPGDPKLPQPFEYVYGELDTLRGVLVDESGAPRAGAWLRLRAGAPLVQGAEEDPFAPEHVVSSLAVTDPNGAFELHVLPGVLHERNHVLEVSLFDDRPWATTIELDADRVVPAEGMQVVIPTVPERVEVTGTVEAEQLTGAVNASLTFVSDFKLPDFVGAVNDRDWCKARTLGDSRSAFRCRSVVYASAHAEGKFTTKLLPGNYRVYIAPSRDTETSRDSLTTVERAAIETQPGGGPQGGLLYKLNRARFVRGSIFGLSGKPLENALIRVLPLDAPDGANVPGFTASDSVSDARGRFELPIDRGYCAGDDDDDDDDTASCFDVVVQPPEQSGYAWLFQANRQIDGSIEIGNFAMPAPSILAGTVRRKADGVAIAGATVAAFALVRDLGRPGAKRGVLIGRTTTDETGAYELRLPPRVPDE